MTKPISLITGSAIRVGKSIALGLAEMGHDIILHYHSSADQISDTINEITNLGVKVVAYRADLSNIGEIKNLVSKIEDDFGKLNYLVNSAATFIKEPFGSLSLSNWETSINVNLRAPTFLSKLLLPLFANADGDKMIINISDLSGVHIWRSFIHHGISKAGILHLTKILAKELAPEIRANAIVSGPLIPIAGDDEQSEKWQETIRKLPLKRIEGTKPVQQSIKYLIENSFLTGTILHVDGGESLAGPVNH